MSSSTLGPGRAGTPTRPARWPARGVNGCRACRTRCAGATRRSEAQEQSRTDLRNRQPITGKPRDLPLVRGQVVTRLGRALAHLLPRRQKLLARAVSERLHPDREEHLIGRAQLLAGFGPPIRAAQPLAVEQVSPRASSGRSRVRPSLAIELVGCLAIAHQRPGTSQDSERRVGAGQGRGGSDVLEGDACDLRVAGPRRRFERFHRRPRCDEQLLWTVGARVLRGSQRLLVAAKAVAQDREPPRGELDATPWPSGEASSLTSRAPAPDRPSARAP
jgi:hypothetical protein